MKRRRAEKLRHRNPSLAGPGILGGIGEQPGGVYAALRTQHLDEEMLKAEQERREMEDALIRGASDPIAAAIDPLDYARATLDEIEAREAEQEEVKNRASELAEEAQTEPVAHGGRQRTPGRVALTPEVRAEIAEAYRLGQTTTEIGRAWEIGQATLYAILRSAGIPLRGRTGARTPGPPEPPPAEPEDSAVPEPEETAPVPSPNATTASKSPSIKVVARDGGNHYTVTYTVVRTESLIVAAKNVGQAFVEAKRLIDEAEGANADTEVVSVTRTEDGQ